MKIALQLFGHLRFWEQQTVVEAVKKIANSEVDIYGTFWKDEYSVEIDNNNGFKDFKFLELLEEPQFKSKRAPLTRYSYLLQTSKNSRMKIQLKEGIYYDYILVCRPDVHLLLPNDDRIQKFRNKLKNSVDQFTIDTFSELNFKGPGKHFYIDDKIFGGKQEGINIFCGIYNHIYHTDSSMFVPGHHVDPSISIKLYNLFINRILDIRVSLTRLEHFKKQNFSSSIDSGLLTSLRSMQRIEELNEWMSSNNKYFNN